MKGAAWRVGLFTLVGLSLLALAVVLAGGHFFVARESALMRFGTSVYGLQVGAAVVFRGVRVGQITAVDLAPPGPGGVAIPVTAEFERAALRNLLGPGAAEAGDSGARLVPALVARGLVARLATQSLLTGQLYVDLDVEPSRALAARAGAASAPGPVMAPARPGSKELPVIPTAPSQLQSLQAQLEGLDLAQIGRDLSATTASLRQLLAGPEPARLLARAADAAQSLQRLAERIEREVAPLSRSAQGAFGEGQRAAGAVGQSASQLARSAEQMAQQVATAASQVQGQVGALSGAGVAALAQVQRSADAVAAAADALRGAAGDDSSLRLQADRALADVSKAARALRELAEMLERHPETLLRGRAGAP
ncbi:MAG: MCE family protein [Burkholderiales bacterium]|nr:MCE family protein [Burkholderiales bacterium]